jgi:dihydrofolate synthase/folylpolyglutamate synthase
MWAAAEADLLTRSRSRPTQTGTPRDRVATLLATLGNPHRGLPVIHVGGTNGKTTTARIIDSLLSASGLRVARFTSPHLRSLSERITLSGEPLFPELLLSAHQHLSLAMKQVDASPDGPLAFFDAITALALVAFARARPDVAVIEVGVGGRDDATNVMNSRVAVICPIAMDHHRLLGSSLEEIASHKAGIIKAGARAVIAPQAREVDRVLRSRVHDIKARQVLVQRRLELVDRDPAPAGQRLSLRAEAAEHRDLMLPLLGAHQAVNAMTAIVAAQAFLNTRDEALGRSAIRRGLAAATAPGRLEQVSRDPLVIVDASHNPAGMAATVASLVEGFGAARPAVVFTAAADKDAGAMLATLAPYTSELILTGGGPQCWDPTPLKTLAAGLWDRVRVIGELSAAVDAACASSRAGVLISGSVATAGAARELFDAQLSAAAGRKSSAH